MRSTNEGMSIPSTAIRAMLFLIALATCIPKTLADAPGIEACKKLQLEKTTMESQGILADLEKGPQWAKANLPANRVKAILKYLSIYEQVQFRCEYVFAAVEADAAIRKAQEAARARALKNVPPPPVKNPMTRASKAKTTSNRVLATTKPASTTAPTLKNHEQKPVSKQSPPIREKQLSTGFVTPEAQKLWDTKEIPK